MAHDWLRELFRRWGRVPAARRTRLRLTLEPLDARVVPAALPVGLSADMADGRPRFIPGPELTVSRTEVMARVAGADPIGAVAAAAAAPGGFAGLDPARSFVILADGQGSLVQFGLVPGADPVAAVRWLETVPAVRWADPNYSTTQDLRAFVPNDPLYPRQVHLPQIGAAKAWDVTTGAPGVVVAVMDDGVAINHADLKANIWVNPRDTSVPNDRGFVDDKYGWNFMGSSNGSTAPGFGDNNPNPRGTDSHGTHVSGLVAATTNNGVGVSGVAGGNGSPGSGARVMPLKVLAEGGVATPAIYASVLPRAIAYAADNGAKIINASLQYDPFVDGKGTINAVVSAGIEYANSKGVLQIVSAGNSTLADPRKRAIKGVLFVASVSADPANPDRASDFTDFGEFISLSAPGSFAETNTASTKTGIVSTLTLNGGTTSDYGDYRVVDGFPELWVGTSMAAPVAAGTAALIWSRNPTWTREQVAAQLLGTADNIDGVNQKNGRAGLLGTGRVNAARAVTELLPAPRFTGDTLPAEGAQVTGPQLPGGGFTLVAPWRFDSATVTAGNFELRAAGPDGKFDTADDATVPLQLNGGRAYQVGDNRLTFATALLGTGSYRFTAFSGGLRDPFGTPLDGNGDGTGGDDYVRRFRVLVPGAVTGAVFEDADGNGALSVNEAGVAGVKVFLDANGNGQPDAGEPTAVTDFGGRYVFTGVAAGGKLAVGLQAPAGYSPSGDPANPRPVVVPPAGTLPGVDFGLVLQNAVYGTVYQDLNTSGGRDAGEPGAAGLAVVLDTDGNGVYDPPTTKRDSSAVSSPGLFVPDNASVTATLNVSGVAGEIGSVVVRIGITHTWVADLTAVLIAPDGTRVPLFSGVGGSGDNFVNTAFDDNAAVSISNPVDAAPPFTGRFRPQGRLATLAGKPANGQWQLLVSDNAFLDTGTITDFSLFFTTLVGDQRVLPGRDGRFRFDVLPGQTANVGVIQSRGWRPVNPGAFGANTPITVPPGGTLTGRDFGLLADTASPTLAAVTLSGTSPTNAAEVTFAVRFSEPVVGVTPAVFAATGLPGSEVVAVSGSGANYTVRVRAGGTGTGLVGLSVVGAGTVTDLALNPLAGPFPAAGGATYLVDRDPPTAVITAPAAGAVFTAATWPGRVAGTAADPSTPVVRVAVSIQQPGGGAYWDGTGFNSPTEVRLGAALSAGGWELPLAGAAFAGGDGEYTIRAYATDLAGNTAAPAVAAIIFDASPPAVAITPTGGGFVNTSPVPFLFTFTEPVSGFDVSKVAVSAGTVLDATGDPTGRVWTVRVAPGGGSGPLTVTANPGVAVDAAKNATAVAVAANVGFDATAPTVGGVAGIDGQAFTSAAWAGGLAGAAGDDFAGVVRVAVAVRRADTNLYWDGTAFAAPAPQFFAADGTTAWAYQFPAGRFPADGLYQFLVQAADAAGNLALSPATVAIDNAAPVPAVAAPAADGLLNAAAFEAGRVSGTAADATAGPAETRVSVRRGDGLYWDGAAFVAAADPVFLPAGGTAAAWTLPSLTADKLADGQYTVTVRTADRAGNVGQVVSRFTYDNAAPVPAVAAPADGVGYNAAGWAGAFAGTVADAGDTAGVTVAILRQADGKYWNGSFFGSATPVPLPATFTPGATGGSWAYPFSAFSFPGEGKYTAAVQVTDKAGNVGLSASNFSFDNTAPAATVTPATGAAIYSPTSWPGKLTGSAADTLSGVGLVTVSVRQVATGRYFDGAGFTTTAEGRLAAVLASPNATGTGWSFALPASAFPADGDYLLSAYAADVAGNAQAFGTPFLFTYDATPPQAVVQADKGAVTNVAPLAFSVGFTSPVGDLDPAGLAVTNGTVLDVTRRSDSTFTVRVTPAADGPVGLSVTAAAARDAAGNPALPAGPAVGSFDRTPPTVALTAPAGVLPLGESLTVSAEFSEPVAGFGPGSLRVTNGRVLSVAGSGTSYQVQVLPDGPGKVSVSVPAGQFADAAGNPGTASASFTRAAEDPRYAVAVGGVVRMYDAKNGLRGQTAPFGDGYTGSVRVASADFTGDGIPDIVAGTGPGGMTDVRVLDGKTGALVFQITPFEESFTGGVFVAAGDLNGDGVPELIVTPDEGGGPRVRIFDGAGFGQLADFFGIADSAFRGGARAAVGDFNGDGFGDLVVAAGFGGGPRVAVFDGKSVTAGEGNLVRVVGDFFAYETTLRNGVYVAAGDLDGDGKAELVTSGGPGGGPRVTAFSGAELAAGRLTKTADFFAGDPESRSGVRVAVKQMAAGDPAELVVGGGDDAMLRVYAASSLGQASPAAGFEQDLLPGVDVGGVFVG